jgi:circadian clock protein KaiC
MRALARQRDPRVPHLNAGIQIRDSFRGYERIISGSPTRINVDEKNELSRIVQNVQALEEEGL